MQESNNNEPHPFSFFNGRPEQSGLPGTMSIISWNCQCLGNLSTVPVLQDLVRSYHVDVIFLCETLVHTIHIEEIKTLLGFDSCFVVDANGRSGGLAPLQRKPFNCHISNFSPNFINVWIHLDNQPFWRLIGFYGFPSKNQRKDSWNLLQTLVHDSSLPWCILGDFHDLSFND